MTAVLFASYGSSTASEQATKTPVRCATNAALPANTYDGTAQTLTANSNGAIGAIDTSVTVVAGDRILVKNEVTDSHNGIYVVTSAGGAGKYALTRAGDCAASADFVPGMLVPCSEGTVNGNTLLQLTAPAPLTLDTSSMTFGQAAAAVTAGSIGTTQLASSAVTAIKVAAAVLTPGKMAVQGADGSAVRSTIRVAVAAGGGGSADDVAIYTANAPFKFRVIDTSFRCSAGNAGGRTVTLRDTAGGAGNAVSDALACTSTGLSRDATLAATRTIAANGTLVLRRSDSAIAGDLLVEILAET